MSNMKTYSNSHIPSDGRFGFQWIPDSGETPNHKKAIAYAKDLGYRLDELFYPGGTHLAFELTGLSRKDFEFFWKNMHKIHKILYKK